MLNRGSENMNAFAVIDVSQMVACLVGGLESIQSLDPFDRLFHRSNLMRPLAVATPYMFVYCLSILITT